MRIHLFVYAERAEYPEGADLGMMSDDLAKCMTEALEDRLLGFSRRSGFRPEKVEMHMNFAGPLAKGGGGSGN
ncbi:MAG: hypothetical protein LBG06_07490 [Deltaproteobacteria bacterium]|nr:hypothetical protein [Deltaproteobacteria bacterium]